MVLESLRMAWRSLIASKLRAILTMLGVIIGVGSVIALISIGQAATESITSQVQALGANAIVVLPNSAAGVVLHPQDATWLREAVPQISADAPMLMGSVMSDYGTQTWQTSLIGTTPPSLGIQGRSLAEGRYLVSSDVAYYRQVAILGQTTSKQLFGNANPLHRTVMVNGMPLTVIGVLKQGGGAGFTSNPDDVILTPVSTAEEILHTTAVAAIITESRSSAVAPLAVGQIQAVMNRRFHNQNAASVVSESQILHTLSVVTGTLTAMLSGIAGISLLVGGIGIMNIMLVTVSERTREIGLRKAIGAKRRAIVLQFLIESAIISLIGGLVGTALGGGGSLLLTHLLHWQSGVTGGAVALALVFSFGVGIVFGIWPALRASRLDPIEALRYG